MKGRRRRKIPSGREEEGNLLILLNIIKHNEPGKQIKILLLGLCSVCVVYIVCCVCCMSLVVAVAVRQQEEPVPIVLRPRAVALHQRRLNQAGMPTRRTQRAPMCLPTPSSRPPSLPRCAPELAPEGRGQPLGSATVASCGSRLCLCTCRPSRGHDCLRCRVRADGV